MFSSYDVYLSFDANDGDNDAVKLLFDTLNSIGLNCWQESLKAILECPVFIVFISRQYIETSRSELEYAHESGKVILPVLIEKVKLSETSIGHIVNENETKYYSTFKKDFDWLKTLVETIIEKFKRETVEDLDRNRFDSIDCLTNEPFRMLNKMCKLKKFIIVADSSFQSGVHVLDSEFNYLKSFNNENKLKNVTGLCKSKENTIYVLNSAPKSKENLVFAFEFNKKDIEFKEICVFKNLCDKERDLVAMEFNKYRNSVFLIDRLNNSLLELNVENSSYTEREILDALPNFFTKSFLINIYFDDEDEVYVVDGKSDDYGNCCIHRLLIQNKCLKWIGSFGNLELKKPTAIVKLTNENNKELIAVLEKSSPAVVHIYNKNFKYESSVRLNEIVHCSNILIIKERVLITNFSRKMFVYSKNIFSRFVCAEAKLDTADKFQKLYHIFISYNQHSAKKQALELFELLSSNDYNCWLDIKISKVYKEKEILIGLSMVPVVICLITNQYLKSSICNVEIKKSLNEEKIVVLARLEVLTDENENYLKKLKSQSNSKLIEFEFFISDENAVNWKNLVSETIDNYFQRNKRLLNVNLKVVKTVLEPKIFKQINRICMLEEIFVLGDWELGVGVHVFDLNFEYLFTFNHNQKLKKVTGLCKIDEKEIAVVSSVPNTNDNDIFIFKYSKKKNKFKEIFFYNCNDKDRDLCGIEFLNKPNSTDSSLYVIDRMNCSVLMLSRNLNLLSEIDLTKKLPKRFNTPVLRDIKFKNECLYITDSFSAKNHRGNNCVHVVEVATLNWIRTIGEAILNSPVSIHITDTEIAVLERSNQGAIKYFSNSGEYLKITHVSESRYPTSFIELDSNFTIVNDQKNLISIYGTDKIKSEICNIS